MTGPFVTVTAGRVKAGRPGSLEEVEAEEVEVEKLEGEKFNERRVRMMKKRTATATYRTVGEKEREVGCRLRWEDVST